MLQTIWPRPSRSASRPSESSQEKHLTKSGSSGFPQAAYQMKQSRRSSFAGGLDPVTGGISAAGRGQRTSKPCPKSCPLAQFSFARSQPSVPALSSIHIATLHLRCSPRKLPFPDPRAASQSRPLGQPCPVGHPPCNPHRSSVLPYPPEPHNNTRRHIHSSSVTLPSQHHIF